MPQNKDDRRRARPAAAESEIRVTVSGHARHVAAADMSLFAVSAVSRSRVRTAAFQGVSMSRLSDKIIIVLSFTVEDANEMDSQEAI